MNLQLLQRKTKTSLLQTVCASCTRPLGAGCSAPIHPCISSPENSGKQLLQILTSLLTANDCLHLSPPTIALAPLTGNVHVTKANRCLLSCCVAEHLLEGFLFPKAVSSLGGTTVLSMYCSGCLVAIVSLLSVFNLLFKSVVVPEGQ